MVLSFIAPVTLRIRPMVVSSNSTAIIVKGELKKIAPDYDLFQAAEAIEDYLWEKKNLPVNVDLYAAILMKFLGIDESFYLPVFAASRIYGWNAHYLSTL